MQFVPRSARLIGPAIACFLALAVPLACQATTVRPLDLDAIIDDAAVAFQGRCIDNRADFDAQIGLVVTHTTFAVEDSIKGSVGTTHTIKQVGGRVGTMESIIHGIPTFVPGEVYVVFLYGVSSAGFSSSVGLTQGRFQVRQGPRGPEVVNGRDFRELLANIPDSDLSQDVRDQLRSFPERREGLALEEFKRLVRQRIGR